MLQCLNWNLIMNAQCFLNSKCRDYISLLLLLLLLLKLIYQRASNCVLTVLKTQTSTWNGTETWWKDKIYVLIEDSFLEGKKCSYFLCNKIWYSQPENQNSLTIPVQQIYQCKIISFLPNLWYPLSNLGTKLKEWVSHLLYIHQIKSSWLLKRAQARAPMH